MNFFQPFDLWQPAVEDVLFTSDGLAQGIWNRFSDFHTWGILKSNAYPAAMTPIPVSAISPSPNLWPQIAAAPVTLNIANGQVSVGAGSNSSANPPTAGLVGYDMNGNRIAITDDVAWHAGTAGPYGTQSTGNLAIQINPAVNPIYLWISFLETNESYSVLDENGGIHYPEMTDGYCISVTATPIAPQGDGISLFLAKVTWAGGGAGTLTATTTNQYDSTGNNAVEVDPPVTGEPGRIWAAVRPQYVGIVVDKTNPPAIYTQGALLALQDHINAIDPNGTPTPENPHGTTLKAIPGAGQEPIAIGNQLASLTDGLVDKNAAQNAPAFLAAAALPSIQQTALFPNASLEGGITSSPKDRWVKVGGFAGVSTPLLQEAFSNGNGLTQLYPTLSVTSTPNGGGGVPTDGWVGFNHLEDASGMYLISGMTTLLSTGFNALLLTKTLLPGWPTVTYTLVPGQIGIAVLYWNNDQANGYADPQLYRNPNEPNIVDSANVISSEIDVRDLGLVGPQQLSTVLKTDPVQGALANQTFENLVGNSNYLFGSSSITEIQMDGSHVIGAAGTPLVAGSAVPPNAPPLISGSVTDPTLISGGPMAITGRSWTTGSGAGPSFIWQALENVLPGQIYGLSFWYKAASNFNLRFQVGMASGAPNNTPATTSLVTLDNLIALAPLDFTLRNDGDWHRASMMLQTLPNAGVVNPDPSILKYLVFAFQQSGLTVVSGAQFSMTNIQLTLGQWVPGYMAGRSIPSGGIIEFDGLTSCPPGWTEVLGTRGALTVGWNPAGGVSMQTPGLSAGTPITNSGQIGSHQHGLSVLGAEAQEYTGGPAGFGASPVFSNTYNTDLHYVPLPTYTVLKCRAI